MPYNLKMFDSKSTVVAVESRGYGSVVAHSHEFVEIVWVERGRGISVVGNHHVKLGPGDVFVIADKAVSHSVLPAEGEEELSMLNIIFPFDFYDLNYMLFNPASVTNISEIEGGRELICEIRDEYKQKRTFYEKMTYSLTLTLLCKLLRCTPKYRGALRDSRAAQKMQYSGYIEKAVAFIHANYDRQISVDDVATECGLCKAYLQRIFKKEHDTTVKEYLIKYRIEQSCKLLLSTDYSVATIAEMVGFFDLKYFYLKFKQIVCDSPRNYKASNGGKRV